jgi:tetratricopeptide (TPR) repeat protein
MRSAARVAAALALASLAVAPASAQQPPAPVQGDPLVFQRRLAAALRQATSLYEEGDYQGGLERLDSLKGPLAQELSVLNLRGALLTKLGQYKEATGLFESILRTDPGYFPAAFNLGEVKFLQSDYAGALENFRELSRRDPRNELIRFRLFHCLQLLGRDEAGRLAASFHAAGGTPAYYYAQAVLARQAGDERLAARHLAAAHAIYGADGCELFDESLEAVKR